jgi:hypothetical protein
MGKTQRAIDLLSDERFVKLDTNLRYFHEKYDTILANHNERRDMLASFAARHTAESSGYITSTFMRSAPKSNPCWISFRGSKTMPTVRSPNSR